MVGQPGALRNSRGAPVHWRPAPGLGIDRFHLVVHDIGGLVGFELATAMQHRILSLTMLNTTVDVTEFTSPWSMRPFRHRGVGEIWMRSLNRPAFRFLMRLQRISDLSSAAGVVITGPDNVTLTLAWRRRN